MNLSVSDVENYLEAVKCAVKAHRYRLDMNAKRPDNRKLFDTYLLTMRDAENIILNLNVMDFSDAVPNEHAGFEHETLYIFGKEVLLIERYGTAEKLVPLYITQTPPADIRQKAAKLAGLVTPNDNLAL